MSTIHDSQGQASTNIKYCPGVLLTGFISCLWLNYLFFELYYPIYMYIADKTKQDSGVVIVMDSNDCPACVVVLLLSMQTIPGVQ